MKELLLIFAGLVLLAVPFAVEAGEIPDVLYGDGSEFPIWVSAEKALAPSGTFDPALFSEFDRWLLDGFLLQKTPDGDCIRLGQIVLDEKIAGQDRPSKLADAFRRSEWVLAGRVTARAEGFSKFLPGTLFKIHPTEVFKGPREATLDRYVFMPVGVLKVGGVKICKTHPLYAELPDVGEEVVLLVDSWLNKGEILGTGGDTGILTIHKDKSASLPEHYTKAEQKAAKPSTKSDLLSLIRRALQEGN